MKEIKVKKKKKKEEESLINTFLYDEIIPLFY